MSHQRLFGSTKKKISLLKRLGVEAGGRERVGGQGEVAEGVADGAPRERVDGVEAGRVVGGPGEGGLLSLDVDEGLRLRRKTRQG